jgi:hypothetical protein
MLVYVVRLHLFEPFLKGRGSKAFSTNVAG